MNAFSVLWVKKGGGNICTEILCSIYDEYYKKSSMEFNLMESVYNLVDVTVLQ